MHANRLFQISRQCGQKIKFHSRPYYASSQRSSYSTNLKPSQYLKIAVPSVIASACLGYALSIHSPENQLKTVACKYMINTSSSSSVDQQAPIHTHTTSIPTPTLCNGSSDSDSEPEECKFEDCERKMKHWHCETCGRTQRAMNPTSKNPCFDEINDIFPCVACLAKRCEDRDKQAKKPKKTVININLNENDSSSSSPSSSSSSSSSSSPPSSKGKSKNGQLSSSSNSDNRNAAGPSNDGARYASGSSSSANTPNIRRSRQRVDITSPGVYVDEVELPNGFFNTREVERIYANRRNQLISDESSTFYESINNRNSSIRSPNSNLQQPPPPQQQQPSSEIISVDLFDDNDSNRNRRVSITIRNPNDITMETINLSTTDSDTSSRKKKAKKRRGGKLLDRARSHFCFRKPKTKSDDEDDDLGHFVRPNVAFQFAN